jgi:cytochrome c oxidase subunit 3
MSKPGHESSPGEYGNLMFHPYNVMLVLTIIAVSALFLALSVAFIYTRIQGDAGAIKFPFLFGFNAFVLMASSLTMQRAQKAYKKDDTFAFQRSLKLTLWLTLAFLVLQVVAWSLLFSENIFVHSDNSSAYLYLLSILHFFHVVAGLPFLILFMRTAGRQLTEPVHALVYFSDPEKRLRLRLLSIYWHFLDGLWVFLVIFLLFLRWAVT